MERMAAKPKAAVAHASTCNIQGRIQGCIVASLRGRLRPDYMRFLR